ncbi:hypothetical protein HOY80DRAFT_1049197 [Tuber brumale]|nr:hypothetical protein HOY80DRAFT_1049197 [Tuber brumale]
MSITATVPKDYYSPGENPTKTFSAKKRGHPPAALLSVSEKQAAEVSCALVGTSRRLWLKPNPSIPLIYYIHAPLSPVLLSTIPKGAPFDLDFLISVLHWASYLVGCVIFQVLIWFKLLHLGQVGSRKFIGIPS